MLGKERTGDGGVELLCEGLRSPDCQLLMLVWVRAAAGILVQRGQVQVFICSSEYPEQDAGS